RDKLVTGVQTCALPIFDVHTEIQVDVPHVQVEVDLAKAQRYGLKPGDVRRAAATFIASTEVSDIHRDGKVYDVMVWSTPDTRQKIGRASCRERVEGWWG